MQYQQDRQAMWTYSNAAEGYNAAMEKEYLAE